MGGLEFQVEVIYEGIGMGVTGHGNPMAQEKMGKLEEEAIVEDSEQKEFSQSRWIEHEGRDWKEGASRLQRKCFVCMSKMEVAMLNRMVATEN